jgi:hypothetical protein
VSKGKRGANLYKLARRSAKRQLRALIHEAQLLLELFPDLRDSVDASSLPLSFIVARGARRVAKRRVKPRRRRKRGTAARKRVGQRLKKHWAVRRRSMKR